MAINDGVRDCVLQVLAIQPKRSDKPEPWLKPLQQIRLSGHVSTPPLVDGRRVLVTTTAGVVRVFELSGSNTKTPLHDVAETSVEGAANLVRFALMQSGQFWIADSRLTKYDVQAARGRLMPKWPVDEDSAYLQPPVAFGQAVVTVRRKVGMPGALVSAVAMQDPDKYWETQIASPPAGPPLVLGEDGRVVAVTANGGVFRIDAGPSGPAVVNETVATADAFLLFRQPLRHVVCLAGGLLAISSGAGSDQFGVFDPKTPSPLIYWLKLPEKQKLALRRPHSAVACWRRARPGRCTCSILKPASRWPSRSNRDSRPERNSTGLPRWPSATGRPCWSMRSSGRCTVSAFRMSRGRT